MFSIVGLCHIQIIRIKWFSMTVHVTQLSLPASLHAYVQTLISAYLLSHLTRIVGFMFIRLNIQGCCFFGLTVVVLLRNKQDYMVALIAGQEWVSNHYYNFLTLSIQKHKSTNIKGAKLKQKKLT